VVQFFQNPFTNHIQVIINIRIQKPEHLDMQSVQISRPFTIMLDCFVSEMRIPVKLNGQPCSRAVKIKDVCANTVLAAKFVTTKIAPLQDAPELCFCRSGIVSELFSAGF